MERILIIDDDPGFRALLQTILDGDGYEVVTGAEAFEPGRNVGAIRSGVCSGDFLHHSFACLLQPTEDGRAKTLRQPGQGRLILFAQVGPYFRRHLSLP